MARIHHGQDRRARQTDRKVDLNKYRGRDEYMDGQDNQTDTGHRARVLRMELDAMLTGEKKPNGASDTDRIGRWG